MDIALTLLLRLVPLYCVIFLGFVAGRFLGAKKETVATLLLYIVAPIVVFHGVVTTTLDFSALSLPLLFLVVGCCIAFFFFMTGSRIWNDATKNMLGFTAGTGNTGYFGIPVAIAIFGEEILGLVVLSTLGLIVFENTVGFFMTARGHHTPLESIRKVLTLPTIYAFALGIAVNLSGFDLGESYTSVAVNFRGAYTILGMMIIGLGIADMKGFVVDYALLGLAFLAKFIVWPVCIALIVWLDTQYFHLYTSQIHGVLLLLAITPLAANTVTVATQLKAEPEKAAFAVFLSTVFALLYIPVMVVLFIR